MPCSDLRENMEIIPKICAVAVELRERGWNCGGGGGEGLTGAELPRCSLTVNHKLPISHKCWLSSLFLD